MRIYIPMPTSQRTTVPVDSCISDLVQLLNDHGFNTYNSCCGHGLQPAAIVFRDGTEITAGPVFPPKHHLLARSA